MINCMYNINNNTFIIFNAVDYRLVRFVCKINVIVKDCNKAVKGDDIDLDVY